MKRATSLPLVLALASACGSARRGEATEGPMDLTDRELERGALVFASTCYKCHPGGEAGLGPALNDKPLPGFLVRTQVRQGLGTMPSFSDEALPDDQLDDVVAYVRALREH